MFDILAMYMCCGFIGFITTIWRRQSERTFGQFVQETLACTSNSVQSRPRNCRGLPTLLTFVPIRCRRQARYPASCLLIQPRVSGCHGLVRAAENCALTAPILWTVIRGWLGHVMSPVGSTKRPVERRKPLPSCSGYDHAGTSPDHGVLIRYLKH